MLRLLIEILKFVKVCKEKKKLLKCKTKRSICKKCLENLKSPIKAK